MSADATMFAEGTSRKAKCSTHPPGRIRHPLTKRRLSEGGEPVPDAAACKTPVARRKAFKMSK